MARLGTAKRPAVIRVRTMAKAVEMVSLAEKCGWKIIVGIEPDEPEDLTEWERLMNEQTPAFKVSSLPGRPTTKVGRNEPCPCGSGKKYKKCCGRE